MKKHVFAFIALILSVPAFAQIPIAYYDFEDNTSRSTFQNQAEAEVNTGSATSLAIGAVGTLGNATGSGGYWGGPANGTSISTYRGSSSSSTDPQTAADHYIQFKVSTSGFSGISMNMDVFPNSFSSEYYGVLYSTNGTTWSFAGSCGTPGTGSFPWVYFFGGYWGLCSLSFPAAADNQSSLYIRIYGYYSASSSTSASLSFDNIGINATSTVAGKVFTSLDEYNIYTSTTSGSTGSVLTRGNFTCTGLNTKMTLGSDIGMKSGATFTVSTSATLHTGTSAPNYIFGTGGNFVLNSGTNLVITSVNGITSGTTASGNIQTTGATRTFNAAANYTYTHPSGTAQVTGNGLPSALTGNLTISNSGGATLSQATALSSPSTLYLTTGTFTNGSLLTLNNATTINRDAGALSAAPTFNQFVNLVYSGATTPVTTGFEVPSSAAILGDFTLSKTSSTNTITLGGAVQLNGNFYPNTGVLSLAGNDFTIRSTSSYTASVAAVGASASFTYGGTGRFIAERYISSGRKWRFLSVPTDDAARTIKQSWQEGATSAGSNPVLTYGMQITDNNSGTWSANGFDAYSSGGPSVKSWSGTAWTGIAATSAFIKSTKGYMCYVRGDRTALASGATVAATTLRTKGQLYTGSQAPIAVAAGATVSIGNPYASAIDLRLLSTTGIAGGPAFYVWDPKLTGTYGLGSYQTLSLSGGNYVVVPGGGSYGASGSIQNYIQSGQAFFVIGGTGGNVTFTEAAKATGSQQVFKTAGGEEQIIAANLFLKSGAERELADGAAAFIDNAYSNAADGDDADKIAGTSEKVSFLRSGRQLSVERRKEFTADDTLFLSIGNVKVHEYTWQISLNSIDLHGGTAFFIDKFLNTSSLLSLSDTNTIDFNIANTPGSYAADRFMIVFKPADVVPVTFVSVSALRNNDKTINVRWTIENELNIVSYDVEYSTDGSSFSSTGTRPATGISAYSFEHGGASGGNNYYMIKATEHSGRAIYSAVVKVNALNEKAAVAVYPNPVENKQINISFIKQEQGSYNVQLVNAEGQKVYSTVISISSDNQVSSLQLKNVAAGTYQLLISSKKSAMPVQSVLIK